MYKDVSAPFATVSVRRGEIEKIRALIAQCRVMRLIISFHAGAFRALFDIAKVKHFVMYKTTREKLSRQFHKPLLFICARASISRVLEKCYFTILRRRDGESQPAKRERERRRRRRGT